MKISEKIADYIAEEKTFYSFEFFPPKTDFGMDNLYSRINRMASLHPAYIDNDVILYGTIFKRMANLTTETRINNLS